MKKIFYALFLVIGQLQSISKSPNVVTLFVKDYPTLSALAHPDQSKKPNHKGIYFSYFGYLLATDENGQVTFPRSHQNPKFTLLVTTDAQPIFMASNTISFWQLKEGSHYACYSVEKKQDAETKRWIWEITKIAPPTQGKLPIDTIVIFAQPSAFYIPEGVSLTDSNQQLILPHLYVKEAIELPEDTLKVLEVKNFLRTLNNTYKKEKLAVQSQAE